jgi:glycerol-3-phosphate dehydrogenase (NAD(P)+)
MNFGIFGSGSWGTALAKILTDNGHQVSWCVRSEATADHIRIRHHNPKYLSSVYFDLNRLLLTTKPEELYKQADIILFATPSSFTLEYIDEYKDMLHHKKVISAVKGMLPDNKCFINEYLGRLTGFDPREYATIMGPCHAEEVAAEKLSYLTFSSENKSFANEIAACFKTDFINTIISSDVSGVQYAAVLKNIYALGSGILHGLGYGDNFQSVFVSNAAAEMQRFLASISINNNDAESVNYLSSVYLGDLIVTCYSLHSRNRAFGNLIGKGYSVESTKLSMQMVAEGYNASKAIFELSESMNIIMPIADSVYRILWKGNRAQAEFKLIEKQLS